MWSLQRIEGVLSHGGPCGVACVVLLVMLIVASPPAASYVLVQTAGGTSIHWDSPCVPWWIHESGSEDVTMQTLEDTIGEALAAWSAVEGASLQLHLNGRSCLGRHGATGWPGPHNTLVWHDSEGHWPYSTKVIALTSVTYNSATAVIVDSDIEMNGVQYRFGTTGERDEVDLLQAVLHELGHAVGLDHTPEEDAVMHAKGEPGDFHKRALTDDDRAGIIANHPTPPSGAPATCESDQTGGSVYCPPTPQDPGCAGAGPVHSNHLGLLYLLLVPALLAIGRRHAFGLCAVFVLVFPGKIAWAGEVYTTPGGVPLHWLDDEVALVLDPDVPETVSAGLLETFEDGLKPWNDLACVPVTLSIHGLDSCPGEVIDDGVNCVVWVDRPELWRWPSHLVAITLVHFEGDTGRIVDTDMEFNAAFTEWTNATECNDEAHDLWATFAHETGHLLGLDHSNHPQATMNAVTFPGDCKKRTLHQDDEDTACGLYAGVPYVVESSTTPTDVNSQVDGGNGGDPGGGGTSGGCSIGPTGEMPWLTFWLLVGLIARRPRRRRSVPSPVH